MVNPEPIPGSLALRYLTHPEWDASPSHIHTLIHTNVQESMYRHVFGGKTQKLEIAHMENIHRNSIQTWAQDSNGDHQTVKVAMLPAASAPKTILANYTKWVDWIIACSGSMLCSYKSRASVHISSSQFSSHQTSEWGNFFYLSDFYHSMIIDARWAGSSTSKITDILKIL